MVTAEGGPPAAGGASEPGAGRPAARPPGAPGIGSIFVLAFLVILVPAVAGYALLRLAGLPIAPAGLLGLLLAFICLGLYPMVLVKLGWVPPRRHQGRRS